MITFKQFLMDARKNPEKNPKISIYNKLKKYLNDPDVYISFTNLNKLGINPHSEFNTPLGIYAYPIKEIAEYEEWERKKEIAVPYAGEEPYIWVFKPKDPSKILNLNEVSSKNWDNGIEVLNKYFDNSLVKKIVEARLFTMKLEKISIGKTFWKIILDLIRKEYPRTERMKRITLWNKIFRDIGFDGVVDRKGQGIIHPAEPIQAIFFSKDAIEIKERLLNKSYGKTKEYNRMSEFKIGRFQPEGRNVEYINVVLTYNTKMLDVDNKIMIRIRETINKIANNTTVPSQMLKNFNMIFSFIEQINRNRKYKIEVEKIEYYDPIRFLSKVIEFGDNKFLKDMLEVISNINNKVENPVTAEMLNQEVNYLLTIGAEISEEKTDIINNIIK